MTRHGFSSLGGSAKLNIRPRSSRQPLSPLRTSGTAAMRAMSRKFSHFAERFMPDGTTSLDGRRRRFRIPASACMSRRSFGPSMLGRGAGERVS